MGKIIVTSALPYANGRLHIGQVAGCYLPADIYTKYQRLKNRDVIHICGTDEHGVLITLRAMKEKLSPKEIVDKYYSIIKSSLNGLGIEYTNFSRTSRKIHYQTAQKFFLQMYHNGYIKSEISTQLYCSTCHHFLPERFVEGVCPFCQKEGARGDQCESCGRWLEPTMLINPKCQLCGSIPQLKESKHWFLLLGKLENKLKEWLKEKKGWRENVIKFVNSWLKEKLEARCITRDISWGVPVPLPEAEGKVIYVWIEALTGYISATKEWDSEKWEDYWLNKETQLVHFIAKDNIIFHAIVWPCMLFAHGGYILPSYICANEFLNIEGKKISTSREWAVWVDEYLTKFEPDSLRYVLTMNAPEKADVDFKWEDYYLKVNTELCDILGNFVHRTLGFIYKYLKGKIPEHNELSGKDKELIEKLKITKKKVESHLEGFEFKKGLKEVMLYIKECNKYFDYNRPWERKTNYLTVLYTCATVIGNLIYLLHPYLPFASKKIRKIIKLEKEYKWDDIGEIFLPPGLSIEKPEILFTKIPKEKIEEEVKKFL